MRKYDTEIKATKPMERECFKPNRVKLYLFLWQTSNKTSAAMLLLYSDICWFCSIYRYTFFFLVRMCFGFFFCSSISLKHIRSVFLSISLSLSSRCSSLLSFVRFSVHNVCKHYSDCICFERILSAENQCI